MPVKRVKVYVRLRTDVIVSNVKHCKIDAAGHFLGTVKLASHVDLVNDVHRIRREKMLNDRIYILVNNNS